MKKQDTDKIFEETFDLIMELAEVSVKKGIHLDNDLEGGLFRLSLEDDYREMKLFKARIEYAITQIKNGTFKIKEADEILPIQKVA